MAQGLLRRTRLVRIIEAEDHLRLAVYIRQRKRAGWSDRAIADSLGVSPSFINVRVRELGISLWQRAALAWELVPEEDQPELGVAG